ncbi:MAG: response regulator [Gammaproteobacteria bacterium]|nr:response regulator [Gammaproteobacteria bacterium]
MAKSVLVVDDEPSILASLEYLMLRTGYRVRTATDGDAALESVATAPPDLILLDINMPKRTGYEVCEIVRANPEWRSIRIIMLTAQARDVEREKGLALGADAYLIKPVASQEVIDCVKRLLE